MHDLPFRLPHGLRRAAHESANPLYSPATLRKATRVTSERQDDAMNYKMTVKAKVSGGFADPESQLLGLRQPANRAAKTSSRKLSVDTSSPADEPAIPEGAAGRRWKRMERNDGRNPAVFPGQSGVRRRDECAIGKEADATGWAREAEVEREGEKARS
ncbi:hypothetical protein KM043_015543 [Ampulex compressa]|nr:hypothetical protein KM043_015543 [Ampulex compressa]